MQMLLACFLAIFEVDLSYLLCSVVIFFKSFVGMYCNELPATSSNMACLLVSL